MVVGKIETRAEPLRRTIHVETAERVFGSSAMRSPTPGTSRGRALNTVWLASVGAGFASMRAATSQESLRSFRLTRNGLLSIRPQYDEIDYLINYPVPHPLIASTLAAHENVLEMYRHHLPAALPRPVSRLG